MHGEREKQRKERENKSRKLEKSWEIGRREEREK
jgi:hypothetical protein